MKPVELIMTARKSNSDDAMTPEAAATEPPAAPDQHGDDTAAPPATPAEDAAPVADHTEEQAAAPEADPSPTKKDARANRARRKKARKTAGAKPKQEQGPQEDAAKPTGAAAPDDTPNLRCLKVMREMVPQLPAGILPPQIEKLFPDAASRAAPVCV